MNTLKCALLVLCGILASHAADSAEPSDSDHKIDNLQQPLYSPFIERYILDELRQIRTDMQAQRAELIEKVVEKELAVADKSMAYAGNTITYFFYLILAASSLLVLIGWTSMRDIRSNIKNYADQEVARLTAEYEHRLQALEEELHKKSRHISQAQEAIEKTNEIHSLWLRASQESNPQSKIALYDEILAIRPRDTEALTYKADAVLSLNEPQWAISLCDRTLKIEPENAHAYYQRACAYAALDQDSKAMDDLEQAITLSPALKLDAENEENFKSLADNRRYQQIIKQSA